MKFVKRGLIIALALTSVGTGCFGQIARDSKPSVFSASAAGGFASRETQVKGPLHHYTFLIGTQYNENNLYGYYGAGGYYPSLGLVAGIYHYNKAVFPGGTPYSNHYSLSLHYEQTFWSSGKWSSNWFLEEGFGYTQDCYNPERNPESTYGGHFHIAFRAAAYISYNVSDHWRLSFGPSYSHHSNSKTHFINTGCDAVSAELSVTYLCEPIKKNTEKVSLDSMGVRKKYWDFHYGACLTGTAMDDVNMSSYISHKASIAHLWRTHRKFAFGVGADAFFDKGGNEGRNAFGISGAVDYYLTRNLLFSGRVGAYLNGSADNTSPIYETVGLNYTMDGSKWFIPYLGIYTKANAGKAEHLEFVIGFRL